MYIFGKQKGVGATGVVRRSAYPARAIWPPKSVAKTGSQVKSITAIVFEGDWL